MDTTYVKPLCYRISVAPISPGNIAVGIDSLTDFHFGSVRPGHTNGPGGSAGR